jgi:hypothetical protein
MPKLEKQEAKTFQSSNIPHFAKPAKLFFKAIMMLIYWKFKNNINICIMYYNFSCYST